MKSDPGWERGFLAGLPLRAIPGIGPKTAERLGQHGLVDVAQIQKMSHPELARMLDDDDATSLKRRTDGWIATGAIFHEALHTAASDADSTRFSRELILCSGTPYCMVCVWLQANVPPFSRSSVGHEANNKLAPGRPLDRVGLYGGKPTADRCGG